MFDKMQFLIKLSRHRHTSGCFQSKTVDLDQPIPKKGKIVVEFNFEKGISSLLIIVNNKDRLTSHRMMKPKANIKKKELVSKQVCPK